MTEETYRATDKGKMYVRLSQAEDIKTRLPSPFGAGTGNREKGTGNRKK